MTKTSDDVGQLSADLDVAWAALVRISGNGPCADDPWTIATLARAQIKTKQPEENDVLRSENSTLAVVRAALYRIKSIAETIRQDETLRRNCAWNAAAASEITALAEVAHELLTNHMYKD